METVGIMVDGKVKPIRVGKGKNMRWFDPFEAIAYLDKNITIGRDYILADGTVVPNKKIVVKKNSLGLRMFGAVDYLVNYHKYVAVYR